MSAHDIDTVLEWRGCTVVDRDGEKIGKFEELYLDPADRPAWAAVTTGLFGTRQSFVPLAEATEVQDGLRVPFEKDRVKSAPNIDPDAQLTEEEEQELYRHYGLVEGDGAGEDGGEEPPTADAEGRADAGAVSAAPGRPDTGDEEARADVDADADPDVDAHDAMTRSEEELQVGTRRRVRGRARLKKYVVTEHVQRTVPVQREEVRVEYDPAAPEDSEREAGES